MFTKHSNGRITYDSVKSVDGRRKSYLHSWFIDMLQSLKESGFEIDTINDQLPAYGKIIESAKGTQTVIKDGKRITRYVLLYWCEFNATETWRKNGNR